LVWFMCISPSNFRHFRVILALFWSILVKSTRNVAETYQEVPETFQEHFLVFTETFQQHFFTTDWNVSANLNPKPTPLVDWASCEPNQEGRAPPGPPPPWRAAS
jgi:hypothetical protein